MDPARELRAEEIFTEALELPEGSRNGFLEISCGSDRELRMRVESLLQAHAAGRQIFDSKPFQKQLHDALAAAADAGREGAPAVQDLRVGEKLSHFRFVEKVGRGGMGEVYRARDEHLPRDVAIKVLSTDILADDQTRRRFRKEAEALSLLNHPHIATVFDFDSQQGVDFLVMEYVEGGTLAEKLRGGALPADEVLRIGSEIAEALETAHKHGIVHRDLKPGNVGLTPEGRVKVLDFGLATVLRPATETATTESITGAPGFAGTLPYMAPEQLRGESIDHRCDLYALGVVLYEMSTGRRPFDQTSGPALAGDIMHKPPEPPRRLTSGIPLKLEQVVLRCLEKTPDRRYQSAGELLRGLRGVNTRTFLSWAKSFPHFRRLLGPVVAVVVAAAVMAIFNPGGLRDRLLQIGQPKTTTLLIVPFEIRGQSEGADYVGRAFAEALAVNLATRPALKVLPVPHAEEVDAKTAKGLQSARSLGAGFVLDGALTRNANSAQVSINILNTHEGNIVWGIQNRLAHEGLSAMADLLAAEVASHLGVTSPKHYDYFLYASGSETMAASHELAEARGALRREEYSVPAGAAPGTLSPALETTQKLVVAFPNEVDARVMRTWALAVEARRGASTSPERQAFEASLAGLQRIDPDNPWADHSRAFILGYEQRNPEALQIYTKLLARSDLTPAARAYLLSQRAEVEFVLPDLPGAFSDLDAAIRLDPANELFFLIYSDILLRGTERLEDALARAQQAVALNPANGLANLDLGRALLYLGRYEESLEPLNKAAKANWDYGEYGWALSLAGHTNEALSLLSMRCNDHVRFCGRYAVALAHAGRRKEAKAVIDSAFSNPNTFGAFRSLAAFHAVSGNPSEALRALRRSMELASTQLFHVAYNMSPSFNPDLATLRGDPEFEAFLADIRKRWEAH